MITKGCQETDLSSHQLKGLDEPERIQRVVCGESEDELPADQVATLWTSWTSADPTEFVGRRNELKRAVELLGPTPVCNGDRTASIGKNSVAASGLPPGSCRGGVGPFPVPLGSDHRGKASAIAAVLGDEAADAHGQPSASISGTDGCLLVLDSFEHLLPAGRSVGVLLCTTCAMKFLVTSQAGIGHPRRTTLFAQTYAASRPAGARCGVSQTHRKRGVVCAARASSGSVI